jgi:hypothetical protein
VWVLVWMQLITGMPLQYYQLNSFESRTECELYKEMAKVMVTDNNMTVACLNVRIEQ